MTIKNVDWKEAVGIVAGWDLDWDETAVVVNKTKCVPRNTLIEVIHEGIEDKTTVYEIMRQLLQEELIRPQRMTSRKDKETGTQKSFLVHELNRVRAQGVWDELDAKEGW